MTCCISQSEKYSRRYLTVNPRIFKRPEKIRLGPSKAICYKSLLFGAAYECKMLLRCVVFGCSDTPKPKSRMILHKIPYDGNSRPEAIKRRTRWVDFVKRKHAKLEPSSSSCICSKHLEAGRICSPSKLAWANLHSVAEKKDEIGVSSFATLFAASEGDE